LEAENNPQKLNRHRYNGKEFIEDMGYDSYDYGFRGYYPAGGRFTSMDPLCEKYYSISPYVYCSNNPVNRIDPDGRADFWLNGQVIGNDGVDDQRILVLKTTQKSFDSEKDHVYGAGLSRKELNATVDFIKANSGNTEAFQNNRMPYTNSIGIESSADNRQAMINIVSQDNGNGGTATANNREYGGSIQNGTVVVATPGAVADPAVQSEASISLPYANGISTFHSHPSGTVVEGSSTNPFSTGAMSSIGSTKTSSFTQFPSSTDVTNAANNVNYVFGRSDGKVYIYNSSGVQAVIPMKRFVTPKPMR
jgi:RHS repeat-associated protein